MKILSQYICFCIGLSFFAAAVAAEEQIVLQRGPITVTVEDINHYIITNTPEQERNKILKQNNIYRTMAENIYIIRYLAMEAENNKDLDWEQLNWDIKFQGKRRLMTAQLNYDRGLAFEGIDWDQAANEIYIVETDKFRLPDKVNVSHVLIKPSATHTEEQALLIANEVREKALNGDDFAALAEEYSEDASVKNNKGNLGFFTRGRMAKPFEEAAFSMAGSPAGTISEVVKTQFGYHVLQFHSYEPGKQQSFEEAKRNIIISLQQKKLDQIQQDQMITLRSATDIELNAALLEQLKAEQLGSISDNKE